MKKHLHHKRALLLVDNFEHVIAAAPAVSELLVACPDLKVLMTSRAALHLSGEHVYPVPPLELPDPERPTDDIETLSRSSSVALFVARAKAIEPDFRLTKQNAPAVAEVCARLDGLPLAIELAAARVRLLPPRAMLRRLEHRLEVLTGGMRDAPARQKTLEDTIGWSHDLLGEDERRFFRKLSVFVGGCTIEAAEAVSDAAPEEEVLEKLESLIDKNLLCRMEQTDGEPRLTMLETIQEYALERLKASGEEETVRRAHTDHYLALAEKAEPKLTTAEQLAWLERLEAEHDNLRAALSWSLEREDTETALRLSAALWRFWCSRGNLSEGRRWLEEALAKSGEEAAPLRAKALNGAGYLAWFQGDSERATALREEGLRLPRQRGDKGGIAAALNGLGRLAFTRGDYPAARTMLEEALTMHREIGEKWGIAESLFLSGTAAAFQNDPAAARLLEEALALFREAGDRGYIADSLGVLGMLALGRGDYAAARSLAEECRATVESLGGRRSGKVSGILGDVALGQGEWETARALYEEALPILQDLDDEWWIAWCLEGLAGVAASQRQPARAAQLFGAARALREAIDAPRPVAYRTDYERNLAAARAQLDKATFAAAWAEGRKMTPRQALAAEEPAPDPTTPPPAYPAGLTRREVEVLGLVAAGLTNPQIAQRLFISARTVNAHLNSIYGKCGVNSRSAATRFAVEQDLV